MEAVDGIKRFQCRIIILFFGSNLPFDITCQVLMKEKDLPSLSLFALEILLQLFVASDCLLSF